MRSLDLVIVISYQYFDKKYWFSFALFLSKMKQSSMRNSMKIVIPFPNVSSKPKYLFLHFLLKQSVFSLDLTYPCKTFSFRKILYTSAEKYSAHKVNKTSIVIPMGPLLFCGTTNMMHY